MLSWLLSFEERETLQYASHLYGSTFGKILGVGVTGTFLIKGEPQSSLFFWRFFGIWVFAISQRARSLGIPVQDPLNLKKPPIFATLLIPVVVTGKSLDSPEKGSVNEMSEKCPKNVRKMSGRAENTIFRHFFDSFCLFGRRFCLVTLSNARPFQTCCKSTCLCNAPSLHTVVRFQPNFSACRGFSNLENITIEVSRRSRRKVFSPSSPSLRRTMLCAKLTRQPPDPKLVKVDVLGGFKKASL